MNRAEKNKTRGKQRSDARDIPVTGYPLIVSKYDDRANYGAGTIDQRVVKPLQPDGMLASWIGATPPN